MSRSRQTPTERLHRLAEMVGGRPEGDADPVIQGAAGLESAGPGQITFLVEKRYASQAQTSRAAAILVREPLPGILPVQVVHPQPKLAFARLLEFFYPTPRPAPGVHPTAVVGDCVQLGPGVHIGAQTVLEDGVQVGENTVIAPQVYIGPGCRIGPDCHLEPQVCLLADTTLGARVILHSGTILGTDGFGFVWDGERHYKVPQVGRVEVEDDVELGAANTVDRAAMGLTRIGAGTKTDNQVHLAHNVQIGRNCLLVAQVGISGSTRLGDHVTLAGQVGVAGHLEIGNGTTVTARAGVSSSVGPGEVVSGYPVIPHRRWLRSANAFGRLPDLLERVRSLQARLDRLERKGEEE